MADENDGFGTPKTKTKKDATDATDATPNKPLFETVGAVQSNHNSLHEVNPILTANIVGKPDYNPMRMTPNRANDASDVTHVPESAAALVDRKGDRPTAAENVFAGRDMSGRDDIKVSHDTIITDPVTHVTTRVNPDTLADELAKSDAAARDAA